MIVIHQLDIVAVVVANIFKTVGKALTAGEQLLKAAKASSHRVASGINDFSLGQDQFYQADMSDDTVARAFLLADPSTVYEYRMDADDDEQSLSHSNLVLSASLLTETEWLFNASFDFFGYEAGTLTGLTVSAARAF